MYHIKRNTKKELWARFLPKWDSWSEKMWLTAALSVYKTPALSLRGAEQLGICCSECTRDRLPTAFPYISISLFRRSSDVTAHSMNTSPPCLPCSSPRHKSWSPLTFTHFHSSRFYLCYSFLKRSHIFQNSACQIPSRPPDVTQIPPPLWDEVISIFSNHSSLTLPCYLIIPI